MKLFKGKNSYFLIFSSFMLVNFVFVEIASAGILFRFRRQVIRTTAPQFQQQNYQVRRSTVAMRQTNLNLSARPIGTTADQARMISSYNKYQDRLHRWEQKRARMLNKKEERRKRLEERERKRKLREAKRLQRQQHRAQERQAQAEADTASSATAAKAGSRTTGAGLWSSEPQSSDRKKGFWRSLLESLFGRKSENTSK